MADSKLKITEIQIGFGLSNHRFAQMRDDVQQKPEEKRFANTTLVITGIKSNI